MTRTEFEENISDFSDLISFCMDEDLWFCEDILSDDAANDYVAENLPELIENFAWRDLLEVLSDAENVIDRNYYVKRTGFCEFEGLDDDNFYDIKGDVLDYCEEYDLFDPEEEDTEDDSDEEEAFVEEDECANDEDAPEEDFSINELFKSCASMIDVNQL